MKNKCFFFIISFFLFGFKVFPQVKSDYSVLFYNVENLFDIQNDPSTNDEEFTPEGDRHWTYNRFHQKLINISKVILNASGWEPPDMIGLCEIENREVLENLIKDTPLKAFPYKIIHKQSPDSRGIDVAFIYNEKQFNPIEYNYYPIQTGNGKLLKTREILYISGVVNMTDTLHLFFNHWPSRYSGLLETRPLRVLAAKNLRKHVDELFQKHINPKIIIMGDFNDQPFDESINKYLISEEVSREIFPEELYNLSEDWPANAKGTIKYRTQWSVFDQIIVSGQLLMKNNGLYTNRNLASIVEFPFMIESDKRYGGEKPNRTFTGFTYKGGFSDHLPVLLHLKITD